MGKNSWLRKTKKVLASIAVIAMTVSMLPVKTVSAEETRTEYPYTLFAVSNEEGAITVNAENLCVNGSVATNGTVVAGDEVTVNGEVLEQEALSMILLGEALAIGPMKEEYGLKFYDLIPKSGNPYCFEVQKYPYLVSGHYVTVTGMLVDEVKKQTMLEISSWGKKYYINYDEYIELVDLHSNYLMCNILYVQ